MRALNDAGANGQAAFAELGVAHALLVVSVVTDEGIERRELLVGGGERQTVEQFADGGVR